MYYLLTCTTDSASQSEAHLKFYSLVELLKNFGITAKRAFGDFDLYTPRDSYDLPEPNKYGSKNTYLLEVQKDRFEQFFEDLGQYTNWFGHEEGVYGDEYSLTNKLKFLEKYQIPLHQSEIDALDYLFGQSGILSLREFTLAIKKTLSRTTA